jgi:hypothetical protein
MIRTISALAALLIAITSTSAIAATGRSFIPNYVMYYASGSNFYSSYYSFSNITDKDLDVSIKFINYVNSSGAPTILVDSGNNPNSGIFVATNMKNYTESATGYSVKFTISPYESSELIVNTSTSTYQFGYGIIEWQQNSEIATAMLANGHVRINGAIAHSIPIHGGTPF